MLRAVVVGPHHRAAHDMSTAALALALALLLGSAPAVVRARAAPPPARRPMRRGTISADPLAVASSLDVFAVCLSAGMAVPAAAFATAPSAPPELAAILCRAADLLALGADPVTAWSVPGGVRGMARSQDHILALLRLARRSSASGAALAEGVAELATQSRHDAAHRASAAAERASVVIAGPLGLCFLPAFICLGIAPVVAGLASDVLGSGLL